MTGQGERPRAHDVRVGGRERLAFELLWGLLDVWRELLVLGVVQLVGHVDVACTLVRRERGQRDRAERGAFLGKRWTAVDDDAIQCAEVDTDRQLDAFLDESTGVESTSATVSVLMSVNAGNETNDESNEVRYTSREMSALVLVVIHQAS